MKKIAYTAFVFLLAVFLATSCKSKKQETTQTTVDTSITTAPVQISPDDALTQGLQDATKDYPGVAASVNNGEVTLTGTIERDRLPKLLQSVHALNPKKVNNNLTIK